MFGPNFGSLTYLSVTLLDDNFNIQTKYLFENNSKTMNLYATNKRAKTFGSYKNYVTLERGRLKKKVTKST